MKIQLLHLATLAKGIITRIIKFNKNIFKMVYECTNGTSRVTVYIQTADGQFEHVLSHVDLGDEFKFEASYVSEINKKTIDANKAFGLLEKLISKIY